MDKKDKTDNINMFDYKLHLTILIIVVISEYIGIFHIHLIKGVSLVILPIIYALVLAMLLYQLKPFKWIDEKQSRISGQNITLLINTGPLILLEEIGDLGSIFVALPVALLLGFKREAIGMTSSICREPQMAVIIDKYGFNSPEVNGFMIVYLIGAVLGTIFISIIASVLSTLIPLHPYAYALACGVGSTSMNVAAVSSLATIYPAISQQLYAYSGISNLISVILSIYVYILISLPLTEKLYYKLEPIISKYIIRR